MSRASQRSIICGVAVVLCLFQNQIAFALSAEEKDFATAQKLLEAGESVKFRPLVLDWAGKPQAKLRAQWLELYTLFLLSFGHSADLKNIGLAAHLAPKDTHIQATNALALLVERKIIECVNAAKTASLAGPNDLRTQRISTLCNYCYGKGQPPNKSLVIDMANKGGTMPEVYIAADHFFVIRFEKVGQKMVWDAFVKNNPNSSLAYTRRGIFERRSGSLRRAETDLKKALELSPRNDEAAKNLGQVLFKLKKHADCVKAYERLEELGIVYGEGISERAQSKVALRDYQGAIDDYSRALKMYSVKGTRLQQIKGAKANSPLSQRSIYKWLSARADCHRMLGDYEQALSDLKLAGILFPAEVAVLEVKSRIHKDQGKYDLALDEINQLVKDRPHLARNYKERAEIFAKMGRTADAAKDRETARTIEGNTSPFRSRTIPAP